MGVGWPSLPRFARRGEGVQEQRRRGGAVLGLLERWREEPVGGVQRGEKREEGGGHEGRGRDMGKSGETGKPDVESASISHN